MGRSQIVSSGIQFGSPTTIGFIPVVQSITPPLIADSIIEQRADGAVAFIQIGPTDAPQNGSAEQFRVTDGMISLGAGVDSTRIGRGAAAAGLDAVAVGREASASAARTIALGYGVTASQVDTINIGHSQTTDAQNEIFIGRSNSTTSLVGKIIGGTNTATGSGGGAYAIIIGEGNAIAHGATGGGASIVLGDGNTVKRAIVMGTSITAQDTTSATGTMIVLGGGNNVTRAASVVIGGPLNVSAQHNVVIGLGNTTLGTISGQRNVQIGSRTGAVTTSGNDTVALGHNTNGGAFNQTLVIGADYTSVASNCAFIGAGTVDYQIIIFGQGESIASPSARIVRFTNGTGTNNAAASARVVAPRSTGNALPASLILCAGALQASGSTTQTQTDVLAVRMNSASASVAEIVLPNATTRIIAPSNGLSIYNAANSAQILSLTDVGGDFTVIGSTRSARISNASSTGERPAGAFFTNAVTTAANGNVSIGVETGSSVGAQANVVYFSAGGLGLLSAIRATTVATGYGDLELMRSGGTVTIGGNAGATTPVLLLTRASIAEGAGFRLSPGVAPSAPVDGDVWMEATGLFYRIGGVTIGPLS